MYRELKSPLSVQLELTTKCNHKCIHCYNYFRKSTSKDKTLSENEIEQIINNLKVSEVPSLLVTGGEPMLCPDLMFKTFDLAKAAGLKCSLNSNVTLVTPDIAKELKKRNIGVLTSILSFDKTIHDKITSIEGSFDRLLNGIKILQQYEVHVSANMVVMQPNMEQVYETGKFVNSLGISTFTATKVHPAQGATDFEKLKLPAEKISYIFDTLLKLKEEFKFEIDSLMTYPLCLLKDMAKYEQFAKRSCSAGKTGATIGADGELRPCSHSDDCYGNTITESILNIWPRLKEWRDGSLLSRECKECKYVIQCSGGCRMDCKFYGNINGMDPYAIGNNFDLIPPKTKENLELISLEEKFIVNPDIYFRTEKFGEALILNSDFKSIVTKDSAKLLKNLIGKKFTLEEILTQYNVEENFLRKFFTILYKQDVVFLTK